jgi:molybdate transport system regulatory protein
VEISARNQFNGTVRSVRLGAVMSEVVLDIGGQEVVAAITRSSVERMGLQEGSEAIAVIKATDVLVATP